MLLLFDFLYVRYHNSANKDQNGKGIYVLKVIRSGVPLLLVLAILLVNIAATPKSFKLEVTLGKNLISAALQGKPEDQRNMVKYGFGVSDDIKIKTDLQMTPSGDWLAVTGEMKIVAPGNRGAYTLALGGDQMLRRYIVDGKPYYYGPLSGAVQTKVKNEGFVTNVVYDPSNNRALINVTTGVIDDLSLLSFGDDSLNAIARKIFHGEAQG